MGVQGACWGHCGGAWHACACAWVFCVHAERVVCAGWGPACAGIVVLGRCQGAAGCAQGPVTRNPEVDTVFLDRGVFRVRVEDIVGVHGMHVHVPGCSVCMRNAWFAQGGARHVPCMSVRGWCEVGNVGTRRV